MSETKVKASAWRLVEVGRVVLVDGKLAAIVEIVDQKRVLVDGPKTSVVRQVVSLANVVLTPLTIALPRGSRTGTVASKWTASGVDAKWAASSWAKKIAARERRRQLTDFERFQVMVLKKQTRFAVKKALAKA
ncbi:hypothetical protein BABINDRAFT_13325 [Babjeviella inositovora NRRL Y-12698]|uniref:Large ribosomal subunit protein eL14 domain-containing protein n=1 Tax=Babjeviella inositovora NRRL Y-12698 TaxID=984486 RepID=A0A1E3QPT5_9ASCO|nr:uncharacterized protein BABINDRAFT_13325 [Babjeviella inositovora NRRL Y-12698]ODQ79695.1 hypothetical protein BABINDRAFT_13325 [Babjeviella inositovora NRRL Y-12698]